MTSSETKKVVGHKLLTEFKLGIEELFLIQMLVLKAEVTQIYKTCKEAGMTREEYLSASWGWFMETELIKTLDRINNTLARFNRRKR